MSSSAESTDLSTVFILANRTIVVLLGSASSSSFSSELILGSDKTELLNILVNSNNELCILSAINGTSEAGCGRSRV